MSHQNSYCCFNAGNYQQAPYCQTTSWYRKLLKPFAFSIITAILAMSVSHLCDKYSASSSFMSIKSELEYVRSHLSTLMIEVKSIRESHEDLKNKLLEMACVIPKLSDTMLKLKNEVAEENLSNLVRHELEIYDADKTGRTDYALESSGGAILSTRDTVTSSQGIPALSLFGVPLCQKNTPRAVIQSGVLPGECWGFKGSAGSVVIKLLKPIYVSGVSLEHIPQSISPTGETSAAPKNFSLWGLKHLDDKEPFLFGNFIYDNDSSPVQYFKVKVLVQVFSVGLRHQCQIQTMFFFYIITRTVARKEMNLPKIH
ncbi:SUN domain-containing protein 1-like [Cephus cinctus]|uniref:SUN domain-containing protein 1-like n=1 Tax=Cephus cinctus TaxID=211228 RepID=A0AAJ7RDR3_CEPCN|nr:SUN domain-containing protein 1-like [Cephus cinctus]